MRSLPLVLPLATDYILHANVPRIITLNEVGLTFVPIQGVIHGILWLGRKGWKCCKVYQKVPHY